jgi:hypothetical protein
MRISSITISLSPMSLSISIFPTSLLWNKKSPLLVDKKGLAHIRILSYLPRYLYLAGISTSIPLKAGPVAVASSGQSLRHSG